VYSLSDCCPLIQREQIAASQHYDVCSPQRLDRLPQPATGQQMFAAERVESIEQHNIEVTLQASMLKGIVGHNHSHRMLSDQTLTSQHSSGILFMRHPWQKLSQFLRLVVGTSSITAVAATDNSNWATTRAHHFKSLGLGSSDGTERFVVLLELLQEQIDQPRDEGCFSGSADGEITDTNHACRDTLGRASALVERSIATAHHPGIGQFRAPEQGAGDGAQDGSASAQQLAIPRDKTHALTSIPRARVGSSKTRGDGIKTDVGGQFKPENVA
jgi:hypothetical protein